MTPNGGDAITAKRETRLCECKVLPDVGLNYPCVFNVTGPHIYGCGTCKFDLCRCKAESQPCIVAEAQSTVKDGEAAKRVEIHSGPDELGRYHYTLFWMADYHPGDPRGEHRYSERGQVFHAPLPGWYKMD